MNGSDHPWGGSPWSSHEAYCEHDLLAHLD